MDALDLLIRLAACLALLASFLWVVVLFVRACVGIWHGLRRRRTWRFSLRAMMAFFAAIAVPIWLVKSIEADFLLAGWDNPVTWVALLILISVGTVYGAIAWLVVCELVGEGESATRRMQPARIEVPEPADGDDRKIAEEQDNQRSPGRRRWWRRRIRGEFMIVRSGRMQDSSLHDEE